MKRKAFGALIGLLVTLLPAGAWSSEENFPAGSLIIPMDAHYQPEGDGGVLEAYGLVYYLLAHTDANGEADITIYWINGKTTGDSINDPDFTITHQDLTDPLDGTAEDTDGAVVKYYNHDGTSSYLTAYASGDPKTYNNISGEGYKQVTYSGAPFVIHQRDAAKAKEVINNSAWSAVDVHETTVPFSANVHREMIGTPPKIALMNNDEDTTSGNAAILEAYLRLAGICTDVYDIVTPNNIRDGNLDTDGDGEYDYDFLWAPHWAGYEKYNTDANGDGEADVETIVKEVRKFVEAGKALFAECASIEVFEHSQNGRFLTDHGIGHNGGTMDPSTIVYNDVTSSYPQVGDFLYAPEGGHLHNWRPFSAGDDATYSNKIGNPPNQYPAGNPELPLADGSYSSYNNDVTRFVSDNTGWDYYVGGHLDGDDSKGYVVYLGGHKYAKECSTSGSSPGGGGSSGECSENSVELEFEFSKSFGSTMPTLSVIEVNGSAYDANVLSFDFSSASLNGDGKKIQHVYVTNHDGSEVTIETLKMTWNPDKDSDNKDIKFKKLKNITTDTKIDPHDKKSNETIDFGADGICLAADPDASGTGGEDVTDVTSGGDTIGCTDNSGCSWINIAGVRFVLNTLFDIKFTLKSYEYVRSGPIVSYPYLYQGSFEWPSWRGHFRRYNVKSTATTGASDWDTAGEDASGNDHIQVPLQTNSSGPDASRQVFTGSRVYNEAAGKFEWSVIPFETSSTAGAGLDETTYQYYDTDGTTLVSLTLRDEINLTPSNGDDSDEIAVVERLRGRKANEAGTYVAQSNRLGGIQHSSPVIVGRNGKFGEAGLNRGETAYVGDVYGMLHAIDISNCDLASATCDSGDEKWAFIPRHLLGRLKNDRSDPNATQEFAAIDASPTAKDVYYDQDGDGAPEWHTLLALADGGGGNGLTLLDVTDPDWDASNSKYNWKLLWETTHDDLGFTSKPAIMKVKWPVTYTADSDAQECTVSKDGYETKQVIFMASGYSEQQKADRSAATGQTIQGGFNVFAWDIATGDLLWEFSQDYAGSHNDIPGAVTLFDVDGDGYADNVYVGDMEGRLWELSAAPFPEYSSDASETNFSGISADFPSVAHCPLRINPSGTVTVAGVEKQVPLFNANYKGSLQDSNYQGDDVIEPYVPASNTDALKEELGLSEFMYPISVSPAVGRVNPVVVVFGTGGRDWASDGQAYGVYAVLTEKMDAYTADSGSGTLYWKYDTAIGEKVWAAPTIANGLVILSTSFGHMESEKPSDDLVTNTGKLYAFSLTGGDGTSAQVIDQVDTAKTRGSIYVDRGHAYLTTVDNKIIQFGDGNFEVKPVNFKAWKQINN